MQIDIPDNFQKPEWLIISAIVVSLLSHFLVKFFFNFFYKDFLKDYWRKKLELLNDARSNRLSYNGAIDMIEGRYNLLGRQLISYSIVVAERHKGSALSDEDIILQLRTNMNDCMQRAKSDLGRYTSSVAAMPLNRHLMEMTEKDTLAFYAPVVAAVHETKGKETAKLRDVILFQIDLITTEALEVLTSKGCRRVRRARGKIGGKVCKTSVL